VNQPALTDSTLACSGLRPPNRSIAQFTIDGFISHGSRANVKQNRNAQPKANLNSPDDPPLCDVSADELTELLVFRGTGKALHGDGRTPFASCSLWRQALLQSKRILATNNPMALVE
jgi:hypothetical protein